MSKYTTEVRFICEMKAGLTESVGYGSINSVIEKSWDKIFEDFPIYDEAYRQTLCTKILRHYYTREIGAETAGLWQLWLNNRLNEIMPYYNQLYKSALIEFNPLYNYEVTRKHTVDSQTDNKGNENSDGTNGATNHQNTQVGATSTSGRNSTNKYSDTPSGGLNGVVSTDYLTNVTVDEATGNSASDSTETVNGNTTGEYANKRSYTSNVKNIEEYAETVLGKQGGDSYSKMIVEFRKTFLNIDKMIIDELGDLFLNLW